jgi:hypothetical protein
MARSEPVPTGTGVIAAWDAVAKLKANATPRTIVLIINRSLIFRITQPADRFESQSARSYPSNMTRTMMPTIGRHVFM